MTGYTNLNRSLDQHLFSKVIFKYKEKDNCIVVNIKKMLVVHILSYSKTVLVEARDKSQKLP